MLLFRLESVTGDWGHLSFEADEVRCMIPTTWLWWKLGGPLGDDPAISISNGVLIIKVTTNAPARPPGESASISGTFDQIRRIGMALRAYLPPTELENCFITFGDKVIELPSAHWKLGNLKVVAKPPDLTGAINLDCEFKNQQGIDISAKWPTHEASLMGTFTHQDDSWSWSGNAYWKTNAASIAAQFNANSWWPTDVELQCEQFKLPSTMLRLDGYQDLTGNLTINTASNQFTLKATADALPKTSMARSNLPPVHAIIAAHGDTESIALDRLELQAPWVTAALSNPLSLRWTGRLLEPARMSVHMNLNKLPGLALRGSIDGSAQVTFGEDRSPAVKFTLKGERLSGWHLESKTGEVKGELIWPQLAVNRCHVQLMDGSLLDATGRMLLTNALLDELKWKFSGPLLKELVTNVDYTTLEMEGNASGPISNLAHSGSLKLADLKASPLNATQVTAQWQGEGLSLSNVNLKLLAGNSALFAVGEAGLGSSKPGSVNVTLSELSLQDSKKTVMRLQSPCKISFAPDISNGPARSWIGSVDSFNWSGDDCSIRLEGDIAWPTQGTIRASLQNIVASGLADFIQTDPINVTVHDMDLEANWTNGPVRLSLAGNAAMVDDAGRTNAVEVNLSAGQALQIQKLAVASQYAPSLEIEGTFPVQIIPSNGRDWLVVNEKGQIDLHASAPRSDIEIPLSLNPPSKLRLSGARLRFSVDSTPQNPDADLTLAASTISWVSETNTHPIPRLEQVDLRLALSAGKIDLRHLSAIVSGQQIAASGEWPLPSGYWITVWTNRELPDWRQARGQFHAKDVQASAFAEYLPQLLMSEGRADLNVNLSQGGLINGSLLLTNLATRPMGKLPPIRDITARLSLKGTTAALEEFSAQMGGQPIKADGKVDFEGTTPVACQLHLTGSNVPLARSLNLLLRGDLDVTVTANSNTPPAIAGDLILRDGLFVQHANDLVWSGPTRPELRPPYFSITNQAVADWKVDLAIHGDRFMRVRTPVFSGLLSANVRLGGKLREPIPTGDIRINQGRILFPFGTLRVEDGYASINGNDPRGPTIALNAGGRAYNYEVNVAINGPASEANVIFSSTPPLNSEEILLMLSAGEIPQQEYSFSTQAKAGLLATYLGTDLFNRYSGTGASEPRLTITSGEGISEEGELTYSIEYRLTDRWSIIGEYDRFNAYNANVKWRILSR